MQTKILNFKDMRKKSSELPEWITALMRAYREYTETLEAKNAK